MFLARIIFFTSSTFECSRNLFIVFFFLLSFFQIVRNSAVGFNPFLTAAADSPVSTVPPPWSSTDKDPDKQWSTKMSQDAAPPPQWGLIAQSDHEGGAVGAPSWVKNEESSESGDETAVGVGATSNVEHKPSEMVSSILRNPFGAMQQNAQALHTAGVSAAVVTPHQSEIPPFGVPPSNASSTDVSPIHFGLLAQAPPSVIQNQNLAIYEQTPFSHTDGSYSSSPVMPQHQIHQQATEPHLGHSSISHFLYESDICSFIFFIFLFVFFSQVKNCIGNWSILKCIFFLCETFRNCHLNCFQGCKLYLEVNAYISAVVIVVAGAKMRCFCYL